ncbi:hypothetical protein JCM10213_004490 [Rhodosporidiobolus nylandii]
MTAPPPPNVGTHCAFPTCKALDFLPLQCPFCHSAFCKLHASPAAHSCTSDPSLHSLTLDEAKRTASQAGGPELKDLLPDPKRHKREDVEVSAADQAKRDTQQAALEKLRARLAKQKSSAAPASGAAGAGEKKVSPTVALMKLKQRAKPADPKHEKRQGDVPVLERVYLAVKLLEGEGAEEKDMREVWVSKTISAGKALDLFAALFKLNNVNNATSDPAKLLSLASPASDPPTRLVLSEPLSAQVPNGGSVLLLKGFPW